MYVRQHTTILEQLSHNTCFVVTFQQVLSPLQEYNLSEDNHIHHSALYIQYAFNKYFHKEQMNQ